MVLSVFMITRTCTCAYDHVLIVCWSLVLSDITTITITIDSYDISHDSRSITIMIFNFSLQQ